jgi:hypothetical protein
LLVLGFINLLSLETPPTEILRRTAAMITNIAETLGAQTLLELQEEETHRLKQ